MLSTPREQAQRSLSISNRRLTDFHLAFDSGLAAVAVVDLRLVVRVHHFYKFTWYRRILEDRSGEKKTQHSSNLTNQQRYVIRQYWKYDMEHVTSWMVGCTRTAPPGCVRLSASSLWYPWTLVLTASPPTWRCHEHWTVTELEKRLESWIRPTILRVTSISLPW